MNTPSENDKCMPLSPEEIATFAELLDTIGDRTDFPLELEALDGLICALHCAPRPIKPAEYLTALLGEDYMAAFSSTTQCAEFMDFFNRRWHDVGAALAQPIEDLTEPEALVPFLNDWEATLSDMNPDERAEVASLDIAYMGMAWAEGFIWGVEHWEDEWTLPAGHALEDVLDALLDPFYILTIPDAEQATREREHARPEWIGAAILAAYDLRGFWQRVADYTPSEPMRTTPDPGRNDICPCGSGKKFKKCCGAPEKLH